jgi:hypothetical protein
MALPALNYEEDTVVALNTYTTIKDFTLRSLNREGFTALEADIEDLMQIAQRNIWRTANLNAMLTVTTLAVDAAFEAAPTDLLRVKSITMQTGGQSANLRSAPLRQLYLAADVGPPQYFSVVGDNIYFGPTPDQEYTVDITYYKALTNISTNNDSNWVSTNYPELIVWATMYETLMWLKDDNRAGVYYQRMTKMIEEILTSERELHQEGGSLQVTDPRRIQAGSYL